jgi:uncharacterized PurR-regulated membrane protein YhhQ (DUF165 family)
MQYLLYFAATAYGVGTYGSETYGSNAAKKSIFSSLAFDITVLLTILCLVVFIVLLIRSRRRKQQANSYNGPIDPTINVG